ncbi:MAG: enoyl-CoA hydratase/isomerase family protein [Burkholderiales bacterium]|nr:enoyl-CoA hydratase/isomerase family protein [Burkholderiales bacterium]
MLERTAETAVTVLTINRPQRRNALSSELVAALGATLDALDRDVAVRAIVIDAVPPGFCAGSDLKELGSMSLEEVGRHEAATAALARAICAMSKPVIAAVEGFALGGGFVFATSCDLVMTTPACRWHMPEVAIGWIPPWGMDSIIARCGPVVARRLVWGAETIDGTEAHRLGIADSLAPEGQASQQALALARRLALLPQPAVAATKRYFSAQIMAAGEARDAEANRLFLENCHHEAAQTTLKKYGVKQ